MKSDFKVLILVLAINVVVGAAAGGVAGYFAARGMQDAGRGTNVSGSAPTSTKPAVQTQATSTIKLLPLVSLDSSSKAVPEGILARKSPTGILYEHKKVDPELKPAEEVGRAVALTSDGWFAAPLALMQGKRAADLMIWYESSAYPVEKALSDLVTQTVFLKTQARNLSVAPFADLAAGRTGTAIWVENNVLDFVPTSLVSFSASDIPVLKSSDKTDRRLVLAGWTTGQEKGSPAWDSSGSLVGLVESSAQGKISVIPSLGIAASLQSLLADGQVSHAALGLSSVDRSLVRLTPPGDGLPAKGAWIKEMKKSGPADAAGLKVGDVILQVDRDILDGSAELGDIVAEFRPGATVDVRIWRNGKEITLPVTLGTQISSMLIN